MSELGIMVVAGVGFGLFFLMTTLLGSNGKREHLVTLAARWREYSVRHGDRVWEPGRWEWLKSNDAERYAQMHGLRNLVSFSAEILRFEGDDQQTYFNSEAAWMPDKSWMEIYPEETRHSDRFAGVSPAWVTQQFVIYAEPRDVALVFQSPQGATLLTELARAAPSAEVHLSRNDAVAKHYSAESRAPRLYIKVPEWCVDPDRLEACIDLVTRMSRLAPSRFAT